MAGGLEGGRKIRPPAEGRKEREDLHPISYKQEMSTGNKKAGVEDEY